LRLVEPALRQGIGQLLGGALPELLVRVELVQLFQRLLEVLLPVGQALEGLQAVLELVLQILHLLGPLAHLLLVVGVERLLHQLVPLVLQLLELLVLEQLVHFALGGDLSEIVDLLLDFLGVEDGVEIIGRAVGAPGPGRVEE
jgi:hypothetical protein